MNPALKSALIELKNNGVTLDPIEDIDHILTLHALGKKLVDPPAVHGETLRPVLRIGNLTLRRISIGARRWLVDQVAEWFPTDNDRLDLAYAYAMAHAHEPETLWRWLDDRSGFVKALKKWERTITVSMDELRKAIKSFQEESKPEPEAKPGIGDYRNALRILDALVPMPEAYREAVGLKITALQEETDEADRSYGPMIEMLVRDYGQTAEYWLWRVSYQDLCVILSARIARLNAEAREIKGAQNDRSVRDHYAFVTYKSKLMALKKGQLQQ